MGRKPKLTSKQCDEIDVRLQRGESVRDIAKVYGVSPSMISRLFSERITKIKDLANQIVTIEKTLSEMPISEQCKTLNLAAELRVISSNLAGAAKFGSSTSQILAGIANKQAVLLANNPLPTDEEIRSMAILTKTSNDAASISMNLLSINSKTPPDDRKPLSKMSRNELMELAQRG